MNAFEQGRQVRRTSRCDARRDGAPRADNPYASGPARAMWDEGWAASDAILRSLGAG